MSLRDLDFSPGMPPMLVTDCDKINTLDVRRGNDSKSIVMVRLEQFWIRALLR